MGAPTTTSPQNEGAKIDPATVVIIANIAAQVFRVFSGVGKPSTPHLPLQAAIDLGNQTSASYVDGLRKILSAQQYHDLGQQMIGATCNFVNQVRWWNDAHLPGFWLTVITDINNHRSDPNSDPDGFTLNLSLAETFGYIARGIPSTNLPEYYDKADYYLQHTMYPILISMDLSDLATELSNQSTALKTTGQPAQATNGGTNQTGNTTNPVSNLLGQLGIGGTVTQSSSNTMLYLGIAAIILIYIVALKH